jgi:hypothetical protein
LIQSRQGKEADAANLILVTAAHVLENINSGTEAQVILREQRDDKTFVRREVQTSIRDGERPRWKKHPELDIAALAVSWPAEITVPSLPADQLADENAFASQNIRVGQDVWIPCYPAKLEANAAGWPVVRRGSIASHPLVPAGSAKTFLVDFSSFGGDSGAPVIVQPPATDEKSANRKPLVAGLVVGHHRQTDKSSLPFEERTVHTPLGLAIVVHAPAIRQTLELLAR